jgi:hypothetical protein
VADAHGLAAWLQAKGNKARDGLALAVDVFRPGIVAQRARHRFDGRKKDASQ